MSSAGELLIEAEHGNKLALGRLITRIETSQVDASHVLRAMQRRPRTGHIVGFFGPPGVGKSLLVGCLIRSIRAGGQSVAVLATDPTSPVSHGAILGDRVRMQGGGTDEGVFIRSFASRDPLRNLSNATPVAAQLLAGIGYDYVLLETVGSGQADLGTTLVADTNVLVLMPGMGDEVQGMKAGVMELPDVFVLNKADLPDARRSLPMLRYAARAIATEHPKWTPPVIAASAASGEGVSELLAAVQSHREALTAEGSKSGGRETATQFLRDLVAAQLAESVRHRIRHDPRFEELVTAVLAGEVDLYSAAGLILEQHWPDGARQSA